MPLTFTQEDFFVLLCASPRFVVNTVVIVVSYLNVNLCSGILIYQTIVDSISLFPHIFTAMRSCTFSYWLKTKLVEKLGCQNSCHE